MWLTTEHLLARQSRKGNPTQREVATEIRHTVID